MSQSFLALFYFHNPKVTSFKIEYDIFVFNGGEVSVKLKKETVNRIKYNGFVESAHCDIQGSIKNSNNFFELALLKDAIKQILNTIDVSVQFHLTLPYLPYARQDRVCDEGEAFSFKVFAGLLNNLNFDKVTLIDPHSNVNAPLINNCKVISQLNLFHTETLSTAVTKQKNVVFVSPDAGANKKTSELAHYFGCTFVRADKLRDLSTGKITETIVYTDSLEGMTAIIADDICDGGATFIELAKVLKAKKAEKVILYVTHGIFSKGYDPLKNAGIDEIWTTTSFNFDYIRNSLILELHNF